MCLTITYYYNLFITQSVITKTEIFNVFQQLGIIINKLFSKHSFFYLFLFFFISSFTGILLLSVFDSLIINSALLPLILYFSFPRLAIYFENTRVTISKDYKDILEILFTKYYNFILIGFFSGYVFKLIDNWINSAIINFYWFTFNITIITGLTVLTLKNDIFE